MPALAADADITGVTYRLGPRYLTAIIRVPRVASHLTPLWNQRASFWDNIGWQDGETYAWEYATVSRGTLPDDGLREYLPQPATAKWDDTGGVVTLRLARDEALTAVETRRGAVSAVQLDIKMAGDSEDDSVEDEVYDAVHMPLLKAKPCDAWRNQRG